jgi:toxin ParE1/3/4
VIDRGSEDPPPLALRLHPRAAAEIEAALAWYELQSGGLGTEFLRALEATFAKLLRHPEAATEVRPRIRRALLRRFPYGVFYARDEDEVIALAVVHARRDPSSWPGPPEV